MRKRLEDDEEDDDDEEEILNNFKRIPSLYDESVEVIGADDVQSPPSSAGVPRQDGSVLEKTSLRQRNTEKQNDKTFQKLSEQRELLIPIPETLKNTLTHLISNDSKLSPYIFLEIGDSFFLRHHTNKTRGSVNISENSENSEDDDDEDDDDDIRAPVIHGAYDPLDYEQLAVSEEIKNIFNYITKYAPQSIELDNKLCPFIPDFIPAVGDIDAFIKVPRPDGKSDGLGLTVLDEPSTSQSDPAVLQLQLRAVAKQSSTKAMVVKKIENPEKNAKSIERWIKAISDLHSTKPSPTVQYTDPMPNLDNLMQEWPPEMEEKLNATAIPHFDLNCDLSTYVDIICNLFDIPVYESKMQSLHVFFSLYSNMKSTQSQFNQSETNGE